MLNSLFNFFRRSHRRVHIGIKVTRMPNSPTRSGRPRWKMRAMHGSRCLCQMTLAAAYSPQQYETQLSKLIAKVYRRYKWLVASITY